ncbi:MAG: hypothetical protein Q4C46_04995 [Bacillota bacterium]|nr:hypothetical protein [Bacillota bacterium]
MTMTKVINENNRSIKIIHSSNKEKGISKNDAEMDARAVQAVKAAISKAEFCKKPIAKFDVETKTAYVEYPDGRRVNVE